MGFFITHFIFLAFYKFFTVSLQFRFTFASFSPFFHSLFHFFSYFDIFSLDFSSELHPCKVNMPLL